MQNKMIHLLLFLTAYLPFNGIISFAQLIKYVGNRYLTSYNSTSLTDGTWRLNSKVLYFEARAYNVFITRGTVLGGMPRSIGIVRYLFGFGFLFLG